MARVSMSQAYEPVEVEFFGHDFETVDVPRSGAKQATKLTEELEETADDDKIVELIGKLLDIKLVSTNGQKTKPSTLLKKKWNADEVSARRVMVFLQDLRLADAGDEPDRPT